MTSREEYLKRYMSGADGQKKKKKRKVAAPGKLTVRIVDEDGEFPEAEEPSGDDLEEATVAEIIDDGPIKGAVDMSKWKKVTASPEPPQQRRRHDSPDQSPPRRQRHDSPDQSPPRRQRHDSPDQSPPRRQRHDSPDQSPPRRRRNDSPDQSPPRKRRNDSPDQSPPRRQRSDDLSPPRRRAAGEHGVKMADGSSAGLVRADQLAEEARRKRAAEDAKWAKLDPSLIGKGAETIVRDRATGGKVDVKLERLKQREAEAKRIEEEEKYLKWGKGVAQERSRQQKMEDDLAEMAKPMARYRDDKDLDALLRSQDRAGDPMAHLIKKKKKDNVPRYSGPAPAPNRYNIWPGYRWDGVDRSNGFEKKFFQLQADRKATASEAYAWSIEEM